MLVTIILKKGRLYPVVQCVLAIVNYNFFALFSFSISSYLGFLFFFLMCFPLDSIWLA